MPRHLPKSASGVIFQKSANGAIFQKSADGVFSSKKVQMLLVFLKAFAIFFTNRGGNPKVLFIPIMFLK
jgi:hypothetical protein